MALKLLSIILPCYNEGENIEEVIFDVFYVLNTNLGLKDFEIVVVDDGSVDDSWVKLQAIKEKYPLKIIKHSINRGYGAALRSGFLAAEGQWLFYTDSDGQFDLNDFRSFWDLRHEGSIIIGYRHPREDSMFRDVIGKSWTLLSNYILSLSVIDTDCAFKLFHRSLLGKIYFQSEGASVDAELLLAAQKNSFKIIELPVSHHPRQKGKSSALKISTIRKAFQELWQLKKKYN